MKRYVLATWNEKYAGFIQMSNDEVEISNVDNPLDATTFEFIEDAESTIKDANCGTDDFKFSLAWGCNAPDRIFELEYYVNELE